MIIVKPLSFQEIQTLIEMHKNHPSHTPRIRALLQKMRRPLSFADNLYHLRMHIDLVRSRIQQNITERS